MAGGACCRLFSDTLPPFLSDLDKASQGQATADLNVTYLHIDCDLYAGARDALQLLNDRIARGAVLVFDDLVRFSRCVPTCMERCTACQFWECIVY